MFFQTGEPHRATPLWPLPLAFRYNVNGSDLKWKFFCSDGAETGWKTHDRETHERFHLRTPSSAASYIIFQLFFLNSGRLSASLTEPRRPLAVAFIQLQRPWEPWVGGKSGSVVFSQLLISPWVRTDEMCFVYNLDTDLFALCCFSWRKTKKKTKKKRKKEMEDWQSSVKVFWTEGKVCNWGPWREFSLCVKKNYSWKFCFVGAPRLFSKHQVISLFFLISNTTRLHLLIAWTPHPP